MKTKFNYILETIREAAADAISMPEGDKREKELLYVADAVLTLGEAFKNIMDGITVDELRRVTGMPLIECERIYSIYQALDEAHAA